MNQQTAINTDQQTETGNYLFPVFLKLHDKNILIIGGGDVALEKVTAILQHASVKRINIVGIEISPPLKTMARRFPHIYLFEKAYQTTDMIIADLIIAAVNDHETNEQIRRDAHQLRKLINFADKPDLCDFYLSSVVKKGDLKIAISTNGQSPTIAKRLKEVLAETLPDETDELLQNMNLIRDRLKGDLKYKIIRLNHITRDLVIKDTNNEKVAAKWKKTASALLFAFFFMFTGHFILSYVAFPEIISLITQIPDHLSEDFYWMVAAGFLAQLVDGLVGMGYGVTCTTILLSIGVNLPAISGSIHTAEMFSSGISGYSHYKFGNVNKKLFRALLIPGIIGAVTGAFLLSKYGDSYAQYIKPALAAYSIVLGVRILLTAFGKTQRKKVKHVGWLAGAGGFLDSFGGGGWGPLVTSTLISKGRTPRYVIGSVSISEFFITLASAVTFFSLLGISHWQVIAGLIIGSSVSAPLAARLAGKLPLKTMLISVGMMVIIWSARIILKTAGIF
jgi:siroheme synthase-like protein